MSLYAKPHVWLEGVCQRCFMRAAWEGAKHGCEGIVTKEEHRAKNKRVWIRRRARMQRPA